ncbi:N-6 DNA methylase [Cloacibacterium normanense]
MQLKSLLEKLNLSDKDGLFFYGDLDNEKTSFLSIRIKEIFSEEIKPDAFFCINNEPLILFFEKKRDLEKLERQIWNLNQSPAIFIHDDNQWLIKNGFKFLESKKRLDTLTSSKNLKDFEYFELITGHSWKKYQKEFEQKNRVDFYLLKNIEEARSVLTNPELGNLHPKVANSLLGRVIFIRYLIDRNVELNKYHIKGKEDFYQILSNHEETYKFFQQVKEDFNGNLFPLKYKINDIEINEDEKVNVNHLSIISSLLRGGKIHSDSNIEPSLFEIYDFSIIPIEFVSNVYEKFIGVDKQADSGAYYTPLFLVDYIQKETVSKYFLDNPNEYNCKVLDPACGSGIFLVETLRQIISQYTKQYPVNVDNEVEYNQYKDKLKSLLQNNIYGIDKDENAISVAIFSLYITLLDNLKPRSIVGFKFPILENTNFFVADFFDTNNTYNTELKKHHFQFILGNPPWKTKGHPKEKQLFEKYIENRKKLENSNLEIENREIAEAFLVRVSDFNFDESGLIITSKVLYKISRKKEKKGVFRKYFLNHFLVRQVVELSSVRHQIFNNSNDSAVAPATIIFYKKENNTEKLRKNIVKHISLKPNIFFETFKLMVIEKYDIKDVAQKFFIDEDWIWKVLVYGNILDYYFIKRLKDKYSSIRQIVQDTNRFLIGQGVMEGGGDENDFSEFLGYNYINSNKKDVSQYYLKYSDTWTNPIVHRNRNPLLFNENVLLITGGTNNKFQSISAINYEKAVFKSSLTGIKVFNFKDIKILKAISAILNSSFFSYYILSTGSSTGIEREETHDEEKWLVPFNENENLIKYYNVVEDFSRKIHNTTMHDDFLKKQLEDSIDNLNAEVINLFEPSNQERDLIDYTNTVTIPLLKGKGIEKNKVISKIKYKDNILKKYCGIFIDHFGKRFNSEGHYFEVEVQWSDYLIMIKFKILSEPSKEKDLIKWSKLDDKELIINLTKLGFENLSNILFLQKDIKGFEEDYFYIAKPNQYKSWHSALAHLDLSEFIEAFFKINTGIQK